LSKIPKQSPKMMGENGLSRAYISGGITMECILTLEIPKAGRHSVAVAATSDQAVLLKFKATVLESYALAARNAEGQAERLLWQSQHEHMVRVLDYLIPGSLDEQKG
jgi:hypothetical protein